MRLLLLLVWSIYSLLYLFSFSSVCNFIICSLGKLLMKGSPRQISLFSRKVKNNLLAITVAGSKRENKKCRARIAFICAIKAKIRIKDFFNDQIFIC